MLVLQFPFVSTLSSPTPRDTHPPLYPFSCSRRTESGGSIRLLLFGELDLAGEVRFRTALAGAQEDSDRVLLDLTALRLLDCAGLSAIFAGARRAGREGAALILVHPDGQVRRLLDLVGPPPGVDVLGREDLAAGEKVAA
jgi:anti-anti-sigma factor